MYRKLHVPHFLLVVAVMVGKSVLETDFVYIKKSLFFPFPSSPVRFECQRVRVLYFSCPLFFIFLFFTFFIPFLPFLRRHFLFLDLHLNCSFWSIVANESRHLLFFIIIFRFFNIEFDMKEKKHQVSDVIFYCFFVVN